MAVNSWTETSASHRATRRTREMPYMWMEWADNSSQLLFAYGMRQILPWFQWRTSAIHTHTCTLITFLVCKYCKCFHTCTLDMIRRPWALDYRPMEILKAELSLFSIKKIGRNETHSCEIWLLYRKSISCTRTAVPVCCCCCLGIGKGLPRTPLPWNCVSAMNTAISIKMTITII